MFIRRVKSRNSVCFQLGEKRRGRFVFLRQIGCAAAPEKIEALALKAKQVLNEWRVKSQLPLFPAGKPPTAKLSDWRITGYHDVFGSVYDRIGFPRGLLRDLVIARIVYPKSKAATIRYLSRNLGINVEKNRLFRFLDTLDKDQLVQTAFRFVAGHYPGGISVCFYDVTTLYFETAAEDEFRQKGFSKDHRTDTPQILIGLFVDRRGYPFDFEWYEGKTFEGHTFIRAVAAISRKYAFTDLTVVADAGMLSNDNLNYLSGTGINYIVGARLKSLPGTVIRKVLAHAYAGRPVYEKALNGRRLIIDYSLARAKLDAKNRQRTLAKLKQKLALGRTVIRKSKYLAVSGRTAATGIHQGRIDFDRQFDGLKGYWTNQGNPAAAEAVIHQYHQLWRVEKAFRMSKHDLRERPVYHYLPRRIKAHLLLCFVSLLVMKETETVLAAVPCSPERAIELLGKVGRGTARVGKTELAIESELDSTTQLIHNLFTGH